MSEGLKMPSVKLSYEEPLKSRDTISLSKVPCAHFIPLATPSKAKLNLTREYMEEEEIYQEFYS